MATNIMEAPSAAAPVRTRSNRSSIPAGGMLLFPLAAALAALAVHWFVPNQQLAPITWVTGVPAWQHPYPIVLLIVAAGSILASFAHAVIPRLRPWICFHVPLLAILPLWMLVWEFMTVKMNWLILPFFPGPDEVLGDLISDRSKLVVSSWHSLQLLLTGYLIGVFAGITTGVLIGWFSSVRYWAMPAIKFFGPIPATALIPLAFALWKGSFPCGVLLIAYAVWFPVTILTASGIANIRLSYLDVARTLGASEAFLIFRVAIPAALPNIFIGMFMGMSVSFLALIVAETVGVEDGLGWYMRNQRDYMEYSKYYAILIVCAVFFSMIMTALFKLRDYVLAWQKGVIKW